jgi:hypothetical protein
MRKGIHGNLFTVIPQLAHEAAWALVSQALVCDLGCFSQKVSTAGVPARGSRENQGFQRLKRPALVNSPT